MEVMEEGNLMDRIPILLQRDMEYYEHNQVVLQETICSGIVGGRLDFPRYASFASVKIVLWLEDEYFAAYSRHSGLLDLSEINDDGDDRDDDANLAGCGGIVKSSDPEKFVSLTTKSVDSLLEHIHILSQEALDHADLSVLTATIGAAALVKNSLYVYLQNVSKTMCPPKGDDKGGSLKLSYKQFSEMTEALAERLLDLHCRLLTLYIIQDADCLHWENIQPFFESERGSYTIQMWWLYMKGTRQDLWNSVPPSMAQRVFAGMLNETLTILTVRYTQTIPSKARSQLLLVDVSNILLCVAELLPSICEHGEAYIGLNITNQSKIIRDVHAKCHELFCCLLLRGAPLGILYKLLKKGTQSVGLFTPRKGYPSPWIIFTLPKMFPPNLNGHWATKVSEFGTFAALTIELKVLLASPQANWPLLIKVLLMRDAHLSQIIFHHLMKYLPTSDEFVDSHLQPCMNQEGLRTKCDGFLCGKECKDIAEWATVQKDSHKQTNYQTILALSYIVIMTGKASDINRTLISALDKSQIKNWADCLDRRQVWNQKRPPWLEAIIHLVYPVLDPIAHMLITAMQTGASNYQAMALAITCFSEMWDAIPDCLYTVIMCLIEILPADIKPLSDSVLIQILFCALYTKLMECAACEENENDVPIVINDSDPVTSIVRSKRTICQVLAECICAIDEDNKHTELLTSLVKQANHSQKRMRNFETDLFETGISNASTSKLDDLDASGTRPGPGPGMASSDEEYDVENAEYISEILASDVLTTSVGKQSVKMMYKYIKFNVEFLLQQLNVSDVEPDPNDAHPGQRITEEKPAMLNLMFHIGHQPFDQLLTGKMNLDYMAWLQTPMSLTPERAWLQVSQRHEFQENVELSAHEALMVQSVTAQLKKC